MQLQNSYIFIPNPYMKKDSPNKKKDRVIYVEHSFISHFQSVFSSAVKAPRLNNFFLTEYTYTIDFDGNGIEANFLIHKVVEKYYLDVAVTGKSKTLIIKGLEFIQAAIVNSEICKNYISIVSYDSISEYYCNKLYPKLNEMERNLRKLLFNIYVVNFGLDYYQMTISDDLQNKIKGVIQAKGNEERKEIERLQKFFYSMEFVDIQQMLFTPHWTDFDQSIKNDFLNKHEDLSKLTDDELRKAFTEITPRSDWERFFADKMQVDSIQSLLEEIRRSRNSIAHCKFFYQAEYAICNKAMNEFNKAVKSAISITESKDFSKKNGESLAISMASITKRIEEYTKSLEELLPASKQYNINEVISKNISIAFETFSSSIHSLFELNTFISPKDLSIELFKHTKEDNDEDGQLIEGEEDSNI